MNQKERQLIEGITNKQDIARHNACLSILFYGTTVKRPGGESIIEKNPYVRALENVVRKQFSGINYYGRFKEVYDTFVSLFWEYLEHINPDKFAEIQTLAAWLFTVATKFANNKRQEINSSLGLEVEVEKSSFSFKQDVNREDDGESNDDESSDEDDIREDNADTASWASSLLNTYIDQIPHEYYRDLIRSIQIEQVEREVLAEEYGRNVAAITRDLARAMDALIKVALPDIRWRSRKLFKEYRDELTVKSLKTLDSFFAEDRTADIRDKDVSDAYQELLRKSRKLQRNAAKEERVQSRLEKKSQKADL